jgi:hypothetical protein|tara:strand:- start:164 stop:922 length:759 start_codon:yes stop_codon:yes gene_type:complete
MNRDLLRNIIFTLITNLVVAGVIYWATTNSGKNVVRIQFEQVNFSNAIFENIALWARPQLNLNEDAEDDFYSSYWPNIEFEKYGLKNRTDREVRISLSAPEGTKLAISGEFIDFSEIYNFILRPNEEVEVLVFGRNRNMEISYDKRHSTQISANGRLARIDDIWSDRLSIRNELYFRIGPNDIIWIFVIVVFAMTVVVICISIFVDLFFSDEVKAKMISSKSYAQYFGYAKTLRKNDKKKWQEIRDEIKALD